MILILILIFRLFVIHEPSFSGPHGIRPLPQMMSPNGEPDNLVPKLHYQPCPAQPAKPDVKTGSAIFYFFSDWARGPVCRAGPNYAAQWKEKLLEFGEHLGNLHVLVPSPLCGYSGPGRALWLVGRTNYVYRPHLCYVFTFTEETGFGGSR